MHMHMHNGRIWRQAIGPVPVVHAVRVCCGRPTLGCGSCGLSASPGLAGAVRLAVEVMGKKKSPAYAQSAAHAHAQHRRTRACSIGAKVRCMRGADRPSVGTRLDCSQIRDDELRGECKFWRVPFTEAAKKEKPDACQARQAQIMVEIKAAEAAYSECAPAVWASCSAFLRRCFDSRPSQIRS